ncbi:E3 SUMO-protein ligase PIAS1-like [Melanaphis sacchari]|uniref:E3 SUMO-protein ligase PIAS1 n=2 Tax=Melanaphis sacchari TaxID=742174 RepID=A0A2H8U064_9HEMI|nr:E3 SUMO-protein ligase PIAS1-like [Melanaphis sacchari]XP_025207296.1 E3 SUMO-protein ligase PIAS1-like [Melanaphis sacchari]
MNQPPHFSLQSTHINLFHSLNDYKFKKLPFFEIIEEIIGLTPLNSLGNQCTLKNPPKGLKEFVFTFKMSAEQINLLSLNRDISNSKQECLYQCQIRICQIEPGCFEVSDFFPNRLYVRVGDQPCPLPPIPLKKRPEFRRPASPIDCTCQLNLSPDVSNLIKINWTPDGKKYAITICIVKKISADILIKNLQDKEAKSSQDTKNEIVDKLINSDPDFSITSNHFSLLCPMSRTRMKIPAKSINCDHIKCFDADTFIRMNEKKSTWLCPICNASCSYNEIKIESYFMEIVTSPRLEDGDQEIIICADGSWERVLKIKKNNTHVSKEVKSIELMDSDSDDEKRKESKVQPVSFVNLNSGNEKLIKSEKEPNSGVSYQKSKTLKSNFLIDLTSDEEDEPSKKIKLGNYSRAVDTKQSITTVDLQKVQPQQVISSKQEIIEFSSTSSSPTTTEAL